MNNQAQGWLFDLGTGRTRYTAYKDKPSGRFNLCDIERKTCEEMVREYHYSGTHEYEGLDKDGLPTRYCQRLPGIVRAWGLTDGDDLVGCVVYSIPASMTLCRGVCGPEYTRDVLELSRLVITTEAANAASFLVGNSLKLLALEGYTVPTEPGSRERVRKNCAVVVSYADGSDRAGHVGYVYQATNWIYTGQGARQPVYVEDSTGKIVSYTERHIDVKARALGYKWEPNARRGPGLTEYLTEGKHRYVTFVGDRRWVKKARAALRYEELPYPKGKTRKDAPNFTRRPEPSSEVSCPEPTAAASQRPCRRSR